jgi:hypothetical protein
MVELLLRVNFVKRINEMLFIFKPGPFVKVGVGQDVNKTFFYLRF